MGKRKEIKFKLDYPVYEGRQDGVIYRIYTDTTANGTTGPRCTVSTHDTKGKGRTIRTTGHRYFHLDGAKEFCQQIAAGEIDLEALRAEFAAEDAAKEAAAVQGTNMAIVSVYTSQAILSLREYMEEEKHVREVAELCGVDADLMIAEAEGLAKATTFSNAEALRYVAERLEHERGEGWPNGNGFGRWP
jgi:hypothetical protein